jgi:cyclophilin family peptidyl-prolyl cis-trans isomerase
MQLLPESLEARQLFAAQLLTPIINTAGDSSGTATTVDLSTFFADSGHTFLQFSTELGSYRVQLFDEQKPATVKNFLSYVVKHRLDGTLIHRVDALDPAAPITAPAEIIQGGGFSFPGFNEIKKSKPIQNEAQVNGVISNTRGTIAMARTNDPNSATSEWFVNTTDNPGLDPGGFSAEGYAVFGKVVPDDMSVIDAIAAVPRFDTAPGVETSPFKRLPLRNYTNEDLANNVLPTADNVVTTQVSVIPDVLNYSASSSDPTLVNPSISDGQLVLNYGSGTGSAQITVTATALDGSIASSTFNAGVGQLLTLVGGAGNPKSVSVPDADGTVSTITIKGAGTAQVLIKGSGISQTNNRGRVSVSGNNVVLDTIAMTGTDGSTSLSISSKGGSIGGVTVGGISADGTARSISAKGVTITRGMSTTGAVGTVTIAGATGAVLNFGGDFSDAPVTLSLGALSDSGLIVNSAVKSLKLTSAIDTDSTPDPIGTGALQKASIAHDLAEPFSASNISSLSVGGNLTGDITVDQIGKLSVKGNMSDATLTAQLSAADFPDSGTANAKTNLAIGSLSVSGAVANAAVKTPGSVGSISTGSIAGSLITVGAPALTTLPTAVSDLAAPATLNVLKVKGTFSGTSVIARFLGKASVGTLQTSNGGAAFGFAADTIASLSGTTDAGQRFSVRSADTQAEADAALSGATLGDAVVKLL